MPAPDAVEPTDEGSEPIVDLIAIAETLDGVRLARAAAAIANSVRTVPTAQIASRSIRARVAERGPGSVLARSVLDTFHARAGDDTPDGGAEDGAADVEAMLRAPSRPLEPRLRAGLSNLGVAPPETVRVVEGPPADRLLATARADALAGGGRVALPRHVSTGERLALLAHEITHLWQDRDRPPRVPPAATEEGEAQTVEQRVRDVLEQTAPRADPAVAVPSEPARAAGVNGAGPAMSAAAADGDQRAGTPAAPDPAPPRAATPGRASAAPSEAQLKAPEPAVDLRNLREEIYRDLMDRIRVDFERGA